jgi:CRISPR-associated protein Csh1
MIKEIVQFTRALPEETFSKNLKLKEGLYMFLDIQKENGKPVLKNADENGNLNKEDYVLFKIGKDTSPLLEECKEKTAFIDPVSSNKAWNRSIFGLSCNPFALCFKNEHYINEDKHSENFIKKSIDEYLKNSKKYWKEVNYEDEIETFKNFLIDNLWELLSNIEEHTKLGKKNVYIFKKTIKSNFDEQYKLYLQEKIFNKDEYNETTIDGTTWGISDDLSTFADKKIFLKHHTASFLYNTRVSGQQAIEINNFLKADLPNPIPVFVDKEELNHRIFSLYNSEGKRKYSEIIKQLYIESKNDIQNYYLLFWSIGQKGRKIIDFDFVPKFKLHVNKTIANIFNIKKDGKVLSDSKIDNVFELEFEISRLFFTQKNRKTNDSTTVLSKHYFTDKIQADNGSYISEATINNLYTYRKVWYDYIYKSRHNIISCKSFDNMVKSSILEDISHDEEYNNDYIIRKKLNLWFSLYTHFSQNQNRENMKNKTLEMKEKLSNVVADDSKHIESDDMFAFAVGQLIWKILIQNESSNRTHALLESFLQKSDSQLLKREIAKSYDKYKHAFTMYPKKYGFDKIMSEVMGITPDEQNMKNLLPMILAGYFSESIL